MNNLKDIIDESIKDYPNISKEIIEDIVRKTHSRILKINEFESACSVELKLGLCSGYFSKAFNRGTSEIKAIIIKDGSRLKIKLDDEIKRLLDNDFICCKIKKDDINNFQHTINLTKNTLLGFYK